MVIVIINIVVVAVSVVNVVIAVIVAVSVIVDALVVNYYCMSFACDVIVVVPIFFKTSGVWCCPCFFFKKG